jgi:Na+/H+ antiporter NhaC
MMMAMPPTNQGSFKEEFMSKMEFIIILALVFVAIFTWRDAIEAVIDAYVPAQYRQEHNAWFHVLYAFILTVILILVIIAIIAIRRQIS